MGDEKTSRSVASKASSVLKDPTATADEKSVAASALNQAEGQEQEAAAGGKSIPPADEKSKKLARFRANVTSPTVSIGEGEYRREFRAEDQPFEVADDNELQMLRATGLFVEDKEAEKDARTTDDGRPRADEA